MEPKTLPQLFASLVELDPNAPAVSCGERTVTRVQLERRSNRLARAFIDLGVGQGDKVTISLQNGIEFYETCLAVWKAGAIPVPLSWRLPKVERDQILELAEPRLVVGLDDAEVAAALWPLGAEAPADLSDDPLPPAPAVPWKIQTSGGSTGRPKLIVAGATTTMDVDFFIATFGLPRFGVQLVAGPLYHTAAFSQSMFGLMAGQHLVVLPRFDAEAALEAITNRRVQFMIIVPTMMSRMVKAYDLAPDRYSFASLERVWHTGAPCPPWLKQRWIDLVGGDVLYEVYGGTEQQAFTIISGRDWLEHRGSVGPVVFGEMKVVDENDDELPRGQIGEIYLRTPPERPPTYQYIGAEARTLPGGWESLGEMGYIDEAGYVFLSDRRIDMILVGGSNIYPAEIEGALLEHPDVITCAVVGLPDDDLGNRIHAVVQSTEITSGEQLREHLSERLEPHKLPHSYHFVDVSLRDDAGKVRRLAVRDSEMERLGLSRPSSSSASQ